MGYTQSHTEPEGNSRMIGIAAFAAAVTVTLATSSPIPAVVGLASWSLVLLFDRLGRRVSQVEARATMALKASLERGLGTQVEEAQTLRTTQPGQRRGQAVWLHQRQARPGIRTRKDPLSSVAPRVRNLFDRRPVITREIA